MILKNIENKIKLSLAVSVLSMVTAAIIVGLGLYYSYSLVSKSRESIYILDNGIPMLVKRTSTDVNRKVEYKSHINLFHSLFFTLPPDDAFIKHNLGRAMYLIDQSGITEYNNLKENGYYNAILASSSFVSIKPDSISLNQNNRTFTFYGKQRIERESRIITRELITAGQFKDVIRSENNPHGCIITNWKTIGNKTISDVKKKHF